MEPRLTVKAIEIGADELAVLHAIAGIINQKGHAAGGIDLIVGATRRTRFGLDNLNAVLKFLLQDEKARQACVWRVERDIELHWMFGRR